MFFYCSFKHLLLSKMELNEIKKINSKAGSLSIEGLDAINKSLMCRGNRGLLTKIVDVMKKEPTASTFRYTFMLFLSNLLLLVKIHVAQRIINPVGLEMRLIGSGFLCVFFIVVMQQLKKSLTNFY